MGADPQKKTLEANSPLSTARAELKRGNISAAEKIAWDVLSSNPNEEMALTLLGTIRENQKRYSEAEALFRRSIQLNPKSIEASKHLASVLVLQDKDTEAAHQYREALALVPRDVHVKMELARLYMGQHKCSEGLSLIGAIPAEELPSEVIPPKAACLAALAHSSDAAALIAQTQILGTLNRALSHNPNSVPMLLAIPWFHLVRSLPCS